MENASKALIIAGSILVSIVIITLGVMIVSNVTDTINNNSNLSAQEIASYNSQYESYKGIKNGTQFKTLLSNIEAHNRVQTDESRIITVKNSLPATDVKAEEVVGNDNGTASKAAVTTEKNKIRAGYTYEIEFGYDPNSGLITTVFYKQSGQP